jgi:hypothetical protein
MGISLQSAAKIKKYPIQIGKNGKMLFTMKNHVPRFFDGMAGSWKVATFTLKSPNA